MRFVGWPLFVATLLVTPAFAGDDELMVPGPHGGGAYYVNAGQKAHQSDFGYAGAYRAGDFVYISGIVTGSREGTPLDREQFKENLRRAFRTADANFKAAGSSLAEVVDITSFHIWDSPLYPQGKMDHLTAVAEVKKEFMSAPDPTWTAIGVAELLPDSGLIELRMIAYSPQNKE